MITRFQQQWDTFFHREVPPHTFALLRIAFGFFLAVYWWTQWREAELFSDRGALLPLEVSDFPVIAFLLHPPLWFIHIAFFVIFFLLLFFVIGWRVRSSVAVLLLMFLYFFALSHWQFLNSFYSLFIFVLLVFLLPGSDRTFSAAMWQKHGSALAWEPVSILPLRLMAVQITATYLGVGWQKLLLAGWRSGHILFQGFTGRWGTFFGFSLARVLPDWMFDALIYSTVFFECVIPFGLWIRRVQPFFFVWGFLFHTIITLTMGIWWFQVMIPMYVVFLRPEEVCAYCTRLSRGKIRSFAN